MGANSPLGQYAAPVAAAAAVGIIGAYIIASVVPGLPPDSVDRLHDAFLLALGAVFGSAVAVNGYKAPLTAAHARLDRLQTAISATAAGSGDPTTVSTVAAILEDHRPASDDVVIPPATAAGG